MRTVSLTSAPSLLSHDFLIFPVVAHRSKQQPESKRAAKDQWVVFSHDCAAELRKLDREFNGQIARKLKQCGFKPEPKKRIDLLLSRENKAVTLRLSTVSEAALTGSALDEWRRFGGDVWQSARRCKTKDAYLWFSWIPAGNFGRIVGAITEGAELAAYRFDRYKKQGTAGDPLPQRLVVCSPRKLTLQKDLTHARAIAQATIFARDLVNTGPSDLVPADLVAAARKISRTSRGRVSLKVLDRRALKRLGAGALLAVSRGSTTEPYLLHLALRSRSRRAKKIVLIGKGVTFDSGGLSLKPGKSMEDMKCDMAGAAAVLAVMRFLASAGLAHRGSAAPEIHVIVPTAENMPSGSAVKPGDVVSAMNKKTIEILNTDAEGRLILADALCYAAKLEPDTIIDLATLTGACVVALGSEYAGLFANKPELEQKLKTCGAECGELLWPLPLAKEYRSLIDSPIANLCNISPSGGPGAILGALFLQEFVPKDTAWAHLDIAGPAFVTKSNDYIVPGGTGFGVRTLIRFLEEL